MFFAQKLFNYVLVQILIVGLKEVVLLIDELSNFFEIFRVNVLVPFLKLKAVILIDQAILKKTYHVKEFLYEYEGNYVANWESKLYRFFCN